MKKQEALLLLLEAQREPIGLLVRTNDPQAAKMKLYQARASSGDDSLAGLQIRTSPFPEGQLVIVNRQLRLPGKSEPEEPVSAEETEGL